MIESAYDEIQTGLTNILNELHSGFFGQREMWEKCLQAAISCLAAPPPEEIITLADRLELGGPNALEVTDQAAAALRSLAQELERTKDDLRRVQSVYDFAALTAERDALAQEVERLKERNSSKIGAIECLKNEVERANKRIRELEAECALATEATEACQESEKLDQKSRPSV